MNRPSNSRRDRPCDRLLIALTAAIVALACSSDEDVSGTPSGANQNQAGSAPRSDYTQAPNQRELFFGDLHLHSSASFDAFAGGVRTGPVDAYRYARGQAIPHAAGGTIQIQGPPLDFVALTEHATYLGVTSAIQREDHPLREHRAARALLDPDPAVSGPAAQLFMRAVSRQQALPAFVRDEVVVPVWKALVRVANRHYRPGEFTTFVGFEFTSMPFGQNLHRNVLFRGDQVPERPLSALDTPNPEVLWRWMDEARALGDDVIAIPHNANGSNGLMYASQTFDGKPLDADYAARRNRNEPVSEIIQIKGQSETHPRLSDDDEWADFEIIDSVLGRRGQPSKPQGSYARDALRRGLLNQSRDGFNPYAFGMIGSSDGHNAAGPLDERNYFGKVAGHDGTPEQRLRRLDPASPIARRHRGINPYTLRSAAGLAAIWAEENSREALFDALRRREVYATSGTRIRLRFFGGWDFSANDLAGGMASKGYGRGVAMGGELFTQGEDGPTFLVAATRDPNGAALERLQIVKGWVDGEEHHERVIDVACGEGSAPDPVTQRCPRAAPEPSGCVVDPAAGASELATVWQDPDFVRGAPAFYYVRVLETPSCRWSTFQSEQLGQALPDGLPRTIQERAISSPIWVRPALDQETD